MSDPFSSLPIWVNILIFMQQYWYGVMPAILIGGTLGMLRMFTMPLITRTPQELVIILGANKYKVLKVVSHEAPYFYYKKGLYWLADPLPLGHNLIHLYFEGINQPVTHMRRIHTKESNVKSYRELFKLIKPHTAIIPVSPRVFATNWALVINQTEEEVEEGDKKTKVISYDLKLLTNKEAGVKGRQQYRGGFFKRMGLYLTVQKEAEGVSADSSGMSVITVQTVLRRLGNIVKDNNFSSTNAFRLLKNVKKMERDFIMMLTGAFDMRIIIVLMVMILAIIAVFLLFKPGDVSSLPPPPPGVVLPPGSPLG